MNGKFLDNSFKKINGWIYSFDPSMYSYPSSNIEWEDYINLSGDEKITNLNKVSYKLNNMFNLLHTQYFNDESLKTLSIETVGGKKPTTVRTLSPMYEDDEGLKDNNIINNYALGNIYSIVFAKSLPNIVSSNYNGAAKRDNDTFTGQLNPKLGGGDYSGNYIAAFTNNAGIKKSGKSREFNSYQRIPAMSYPFNGQIRNVPVINVDTNYIVQDSADLTTSNNTHGGLAVVQGNNTRPYFRYMTLDRRLDYKYYFVTPSLYKSGGLINGSKDWQDGFICGTIYNGIVLNYDKNYNIVDTNGNLEYRYDNEGNLTWNGAVGDDNKRKFYEVTINGEDKTNEFTFDKNESFPLSYPSKKEFILKGIKDNNINLSFTSCSYDIKSEVNTEVNDSPVVNAITKRGEECTFKGNFSNIVIFIII